LVDSCHATVFGNFPGKTALPAICTAFVVAKPCFSAESGHPHAADPWKLGVLSDSNQSEAIAAPPDRYGAATNSASDRPIVDRGIGQRAATATLQRGNIRNVRDGGPFFLSSTEQEKRS
jgi:hypothetical protein